MSLPSFRHGAGSSNLRVVSWLWGGALYYLPFLCFVFSVVALYRKGMEIHAAILTFTYLLLAFFTSSFIISESHLAVGLFVATLTVIATFEWKKSTFVILLALALVSGSTYEFWVAFFPSAFYFLF